jgi:hypothetical protein
LGDGGGGGLFMVGKEKNVCIEKWDLHTCQIIVSQYALADC